MKKLVIATLAAAAVGGAFATSICDTINSNPGAEGGCRVYDFKASVKLVDGIRKKAKGGICTADGYAYYRVAAKRTLKAVFFECNSCNATNNAAGVFGDPLLFGWSQANADAEATAEATANGGTGTYADRAHFVIATSDQKYKVLSNTELEGGNANPTAFYEFLLLNYFGSNEAEKAKKAEGLIWIDFMEFDKYDEFRLWSILCAGFGAQSKGLLTSLSGNLAGAVGAASWCGIPTVVFEPCRLHPSVEFNAASFTGTPNTPANYVGPASVDNCGVWANLIISDGTAYAAPATTPVIAPLSGIQSFAQDAVSGTWSLKYNASKGKLTSYNALITKTFGTGTASITGKSTAGNNTPFADTARGQYPLFITRQF